MEIDYRVVRSLIWWQRRAWGGAVLVAFVDIIFDLFLTCVKLLKEPGAILRNVPVSAISKFDDVILGGRGGISYCCESRLPCLLRECLQRHVAVVRRHETARAPLDITRVAASWICCVFFSLSNTENLPHTKAANAPTAANVDVRVRADPFGTPMRGW